MKPDSKARNQNSVVWHNATVTRARRERLHGHRSVAVWFTGLSGSGKSTLAHSVEERLHQQGCHTYVLDGDNVRHGLCSDLGFSDKDRDENIRRIGEMAKLFVDGGVIALAAFISPFRKERQFVRERLGPGNYIEIYCQCPVEICEQRDQKGIYRRARAGEIKNFTGISSPYEQPESPDLVVESANLTVEANAERVIALLEDKGIIVAGDSL